MSTFRTSLAFAQLSDNALNGFAENVIDHMTGNTEFPTPIVSMANLTTAQTAFATSIAAAMDAGKQARAERDAARAALLALLRPQAAYVQSIAGEDEAKLLSSGFQTVKMDRTRIVLPQPVVDRLENVQSGKLGLRLKPVDTARAYEVRISYNTGTWQAVGVFTQARSILIEDLQPGTVYTVQARAVGGTTGYSDWSDSVSRMAT